MKTYDDWLEEVKKDGLALDQVPELLQEQIRQELDLSNLKHLKIEQLIEQKGKCESYIKTLSSKLNSQQKRLKWIDSYIYEKTPIKMSFQEVERKLGHKLILIINDKDSEVRI